MNPRPMFDSLEPRHLFATTTPAAAHLPDLRATLVFPPPLYVFPGGQLRPTLLLTNVGASMTKAAKLSLKFYLSKTPQLSPRATPFKTSTTNLLTIAAGKFANVPISATLPETLPGEHLYLIVRVNPGNDSPKEASVKNNTALSKQLTQPLGTYAGHFTATDANAGSMTMALSSASQKNRLKGDITLTTKDGTFHFQGAKVTLKSDGTLVTQVQGSASVPGFGDNTRYNFFTSGSLLNHTYTGTINLTWHTAKSARHSVGTVTLKLKS